jgi:hypothetical protein
MAQKEEKNIIKDNYGIDLIQDEDDQLYTYKIPVNTFLYRGDIGLYKANVEDKVPNKMAFFALEKCRARHYGPLLTYKVIEEIELVSTDKDNYSLLGYIKLEETDNKDPKITSDDSKEATRILKTGFGFGKQNVRETISEDDFKLLDIICKTGFEGYMSDEMTMHRDQQAPRVIKKEGDPKEEVDDTKFHREVALCYPNGCLEFVDQEDYTKEQMDRFEEKANELKLQNKLNEQRREAKKKRKQQNETQYHDRLPFFDKTQTNLSYDNPGRASAESTSSLYESDGLLKFASQPEFTTPPKIQRVSSFERAESDPESQAIAEEEIAKNLGQLKEEVKTPNADGKRLTPTSVLRTPGKYPSAFSTYASSPEYDKSSPKGGKKKKSRKQMKKRKKSRKHKKSRKAKKVKSARKTKRKQKTRKYKK